MKSTWKIINCEEGINQDDMSVRSIVMDEKTIPSSSLSSSSL
jgi:hypothetical protein